MSAYNPKAGAGLVRAALAQMADPENADHKRVLETARAYAHNVGADPDSVNMQSVYTCRSELRKKLGPLTREKVAAYIAEQDKKFLGGGRPAPATARKTAEPPRRSAAPGPRRPLDMLDDAIEFALSCGSWDAARDALDFAERVGERSRGVR